MSCGVDVIPVPGETVLGIPVGTIIQYASSAAPSGYLNCDGSAISRTTYSGLFNLIGTSYGAGNGVTVPLYVWNVASNIISLSFQSPILNTYISVGSSFTFDNGAGTIYYNMIATSSSAFMVQANLIAGNGPGTGGSATLTSPTTFNLPNTVGVTIRGSGTSWNVASTGGADTYALTSTNIASHKHDLTLIQNGNGSSSGGISTSGPPGSGSITSGGQFAVTGGGIYNNSQGNGSGTPTPDTAAGSNGSSFSIINKYLVLHYCIKY